MVAFCESVDVDVAMFCETAGAPMLVRPTAEYRGSHRAQGADAHREQHRGPYFDAAAVDFDAELVLASMLPRGAEEPTETLGGTARPERRGGESVAGPTIFGRPAGLRRRVGSKRTDGTRGETWTRTRPGARGCAIRGDERRAGLGGRVAGGAVRGGRGWRRRRSIGRERTARVGARRARGRRGRRPGVGVRGGRVCGGDAAGETTQILMEDGGILESGTGAKMCDRTAATADFRVERERLRLIGARASPSGWHRASFPWSPARGSARTTPPRRTRTRIRQTRRVLRRLPRREGTPDR